MWVSDLLNPLTNLVLFCGHFMGTSVVAEGTLPSY